MQRVNYDTIAEHYDEPLRDHRVDPSLLAFLDERPDLDPSTVRLLDVGCGTGKQLAANHAHLPAARIVGLDLFRGMLRVARRRCPDVAWVNGDGAALPFADGSFDYITNQFSYAHIQQKAQWLGEVVRVLAPGGRFVMTNIDPWAMQGWLLYRFFPAAWALDQQDFWPVERFTAALATLGCANVQAQRDHRTSHESLHDFATYAAQRHRTSQFIAIPDADYEAGMARLRAALAAAPEGEATVASEFCLVTISGDKPGA